MNSSVTHDEIVHLFGEISDHTIVEILEVNPSYKELEEVAMHLANASDVMGELRRPLEGRAARVFDVLIRAEEDQSDEGRGR